MSNGEFVRQMMKRYSYLNPLHQSMVRRVPQPLYPTTNRTLNQYFVADYDEARNLVMNGNPEPLFRMVSSVM